MSRKDLWEEYRKYLLWRVNFSRSGYGRLTSALHNINFRWELPHDDDRAEDGMMYREDFLADSGERSHLFDDRDCSVLEMLTGLAVRIDNEYTGVPGSPAADEIFWEMIQNLGLDKFNDRNFSRFRIDEIVDNWLDRTFNYNGEGSIFPNLYTTRDQRETCIWDQMQEYLSEHY